MNKLKLPGSKRSLVTVLSLGFMVLGIVCIAWTSFSLWQQTHYSASTTPKNLNKVTVASIATVENGNSAVNLPQDKILYPVYPKEGDNIGSLTIKALNRTLPIFQGTSDNELAKGVGHFNQSVLPGEEDNCILSGHRDTAFRQIGKLKIGDQLIVITAAGTFTYEVYGTRIVHEDDKTVIVPSDHGVLTLTTCYPFNYIGNAPDRYIISANLVK